MSASGAFDGPHAKRIELIHGELREMSPIGDNHEDVLDWLLDWSIRSVDLNKIKLRVQESVGIPEFDSVPQPDFVWMHRRKKRGRPQPKDVALLIEVADSSLRFDLGEKAKLYSASGIEDYWVIDIRHRRAHVHREPCPDGFRSIEIFETGDTIQPVNVTTAALGIAALFTCLD
jgi:Uma2 family endonuclease